jgi:tetratricopeptide (TPR) repeat protein
VANFNNAIDKGSLLEPRGRSAWDMYLDMVKGDPNKPELIPIKTKLADALANEGQQIMDKQMNPTQLDLPVEDYQKASAVFAKAYQLRPENQHLNVMQHVTEGRALTMLQRYEDAQKTLQKAVEIDPNSALAHLSLGIAFREQQRYFLAERELKRAVELQNDWFLPHYHLALTYEAGKSEDDALREYTAALNLNDKNAAIYARMGLLYLSQKKYTAAAAALEKSLAIKPDSDLYNKLGNAYFGMGKNDEASKAYRMARETRSKP